MLKLLFQCAVSCGVGIQQRTVKCMNTETNETEDDSMCLDKPKPTKYQKCHLQECRKNTGRVIHMHETVFSTSTEILQKQGADSICQLLLSSMSLVITGHPDLLLLSCSVGRTTLLSLPAFLALCCHDGEHAFLIYDDTTKLVGLIVLACFR